MESTVLSTPVSSRLATNAWLALGVGVALGLLFWAGMLLTVKSSNAEATIACQAFGLSAIGVCSMWSVVMSVRALLAGEKSKSPTFLLLLVSALWGIWGASLWLYLPGTNPDWPYQLMLPVLLPLFAFVVWSWALIAQFVISHHKARRKSTGQSEPTLIDRRRSVIRGGVQYGIVCVLILAPLPLIVLCSATENSVSKAILQIIPEPIANLTESVVHAIGLNTINVMIISHGNISVERLKLRISEPELFGRSLLVLERRCPDTFKKLAYNSELSHLKGELTISDSDLRSYFGQYIAENCNTHEQLALMTEAVVWVVAGV